ncbi:MAG: tetratricopeptide repeat protein [Candidatus Sumerlaeaceae bacterium]
MKTVLVCRAIRTERTWAIAIATACLVSIAILASAQTTTDPVSLLRQVPRVQFPLDRATPVPPATRSLEALPDGATPWPESSTSSESPKSGVTPTESPSPGEASEAPTPAPRRSLISKLPLIGRLLPESRSRLTEQHELEQPTPTPPVILPPPSPEDGTLASQITPTPAHRQSPTPEIPKNSDLGAAGGVSRTDALPPAKRGILISPESAKSFTTPAAPSWRPPLSQATPPLVMPTVPLPAQTFSSSATPQLSPTPVSAVPQATIAASPSAFRVTFPRLTSADFVPPSSELEPNENARNEYLAALTAGREGKSAEAGRAFRAFAQRYPTSRLAARALFMAALLDTDPSAVAEDISLLRKFFPRSDYLTELELRGVIAPGDAQPQPTESPATSNSVGFLNTADLQQAIKRLREDAERDFRDRNYAAAIAKLENSPLTQNAPELLELLVHSLIALGDNVRAVSTIEKVLAQFPTYEGCKNLRLTYGLLLEDAGKYERAIAEYRKLIEEAPDSVEAQTAHVRIRQLDQLTR